MSEVSAAKRPWSFLSELPTVVASSARSSWYGFEFQVVDIPPAGTFDESSFRIALTSNDGPIKVRRGSIRNAFQNLPPVPRLCLPEDEFSGAWQGAQRARILSVDTAAFERLTHQPFRSGLFERPDGANPAIEHLLRVLQADVTNGHPCGPTLGEEIVASILHQVTPKAAGQTVEHASLSSKELGKLRDLIEANLSSSLTLDSLADSAGFSVRHLCRAFRRSVGLSPHRYILNRRIERATALIRESQLTLDEIAETVGFAHHAHMTATFKRLVGATPAQFRSRRRNVSE
jgi:AraC-like DNA-binding protein